MLHITATEKTKKLDEVKSSILLTCFGQREGKYIIRLYLMITSWKWISIVFYNNLMIIALLKKMLLSSDTSFSRRQSEGKCFDNFVTKLNMLSKECEFSDLQNSLIRDMIVIGITDNHLRQQDTQNVNDVQCLNISCWTLPPNNKFIQCNLLWPIVILLR